jgi:PadR family transcriptional regulator, regulatory protein PadR
MDATQLMKGVLDAAVLAVVEGDDGYGYDIVRRLRESGLEEVGDASVYGTLRRLYANGALTSYVLPSESGPHRKYYGITGLGRQTLDHQREVWRGFVTSMNDLLGTENTNSAKANTSSATSTNVKSTVANKSERGAANDR